MGKLVDSIEVSPYRSFYPESEITNQAGNLVHTFTDYRLAKAFFDTLQTSGDMWQVVELPQLIHSTTWIEE